MKAIGILTVFRQFGMMICFAVTGGFFYGIDGANAAEVKTCVNRIILT